MRNLPDSFWIAVTSETHQFNRYILTLILNIIVNEAFRSNKDVRLQKVVHHIRKSSEHLWNNQMDNSAGVMFSDADCNEQVRI